MAGEGHVYAVVEYAANLGGLSDDFGVPFDGVRGSAMLRRVVAMIAHEGRDLKAMLAATEQRLDAGQLARSMRLSEEMEAALPISPRSSFERI